MDSTTHKNLKQKIYEMSLRRNSKYALKSKLHDQMSKPKSDTETSLQQQNENIDNESQDKSTKLTCKKAYKLKQKYGIISDKTYADSIMYLRNYKTSDLTNHHKNIVALYEYQHKNNVVNDEEMDLT